MIHRAMLAASDATAAAVDALNGAAAEGVTSYHLLRLEQFDDPRIMWGVVAAITAVLTSLVAWQYRRESGSVPTLAAWTLGLLRVLAIVAAIVFFLGPVKRTDRRVVTQSRVEVLVDASQSMTVADEPSADSQQQTRAAAAAAVLTDSPLIAELRSQHDVSMRVFDGTTRRVAAWPRRQNVDAAEANEAPQGEPDSADEPPADWAAGLQPTGAVTHLGDALAELLDDSAGGPLAGVVVLTDGGNNGGVDPLAAADRAAEASVPVATAGLGSTQPRRNARLQELIAPSRAYPDDQVTVRAQVFGEGLRGRQVEVELVARRMQGDAAGAETVVGREAVAFEDDAETRPVEFSLEPTEIGRLELEARLSPPADDQYPGDNTAVAEMSVVETSTRVLLMAGSATRDYRFLRNQLFRDRHATVDVLLQSSPTGISQESNRILTEFPSDRETLFQYDAIVAFDPDWTRLDAGQVDLLDEWVADESGGLIVVAGPVFTAAWVQSPEQAKIRSLYPVEFQRRLTLMDDGVYGSKQPWPLAFSRAGEEADFLWLAETPLESEQAWLSFPGVYGCYAVKGPKPAATVYARYSDPDAGISAELPVYFAEQFYGGGRVFYMGSGEMWRLRSVDTKYFEKLYTQLVRHVSQGRLLRGSSRGRLLVERDRYSVGEVVVVRAQLSTASREPYVAERVTARVTDPDGAGRNVVLTADAKQAGNFVGQFAVSRDGAYRIELPIPDALDEQLSRRIQVAAPDAEFRQTRRDEALLAAVAQRTDGRYYADVTTLATGGNGLPPLASLFPSRAETRIVRGKPDQQFTERLNQVLLGVIAGALFLEWTLRRLLRLA